MLSVNNRLHHGQLYKVDCIWLIKKWRLENADPKIIFLILHSDYNHEECQMLPDKRINYNQVHKVKNLDLCEDKQCRTFVIKTVLQLKSTYREGHSGIVSLVKLQRIMLFLWPNTP